MSLLSWLFPRKAQVENNKNDLREAWKQEIITEMLQAGMAPRRANPNRKGKYDLFYSRTITIERRKR